jgi:hypothetical protein
LFIRRFMVRWLRAGGEQVREHWVNPSRCVLFAQPAADVIAIVAARIDAFDLVRTHLDVVTG